MRRLLVVGTNDVVVVPLLIGDLGSFPFPR